MLRHVLSAAVLFTLGLASAAQAYDPIKQGTCQVFEHKNQKGRSFMLGHGHVLIGAKDPDIGTATSHDPGFLRFTQHWRPFWNDEIGSAKMSPRCFLTLNEHVNKPGRSETFHGSVMGFGWWNDEAGRAWCECRR